MPRQARQASGTGIYHVMMRGINAREAKFYAQEVIRYVIDKAVGEKSIEAIVLGAKLDYQVFMANFNEELKLLKS